MKRSRPLALAVVLAAAGSLPGCFVTRAVGLGPDPSPTEPQRGDSAETLYEKGRRAFSERRWRDANDAFGKVWRDHPESPFAADARFYEAESRYGMEKWDGAFELYKGFLEKNPLSPHAPLIERRLYDMGVYMIQDGRRSFFDTSGEGAAVLDHLATAFPNGDLADDSLLYVSDHYWRSHRPQDAVLRLHELIERYPASEWAYEARLRLAKAYKDINRGAKYDADALRRSAAFYREYVDLVSGDRSRAGEYAAVLEQARAELAEVEELLGRKRIEEADFYLYDGRVEAARTVLRALVRELPDTSAAAEARSRLGDDGGNR